MTGTTASPLSLYRETQAAGVLLPSVLQPWLGEERGNLGRIKKAKRNLTGLEGTSPVPGQAVRDGKRETRHGVRMGKGMNEAMRAAETRCERAGKSCESPSSRAGAAVGS